MKPTNIPPYSPWCVQSFRKISSGIYRMAHYKKDYDFGTQKQEELLPKLEEFFKDSLTPTTGRYDAYDYEGTTASYELKSRNNASTTYPTTCIGQDKVNPNHPKKQVYLFHFTDGTYYIPYDKELFDTFEVKPFLRWRDAWKTKAKDYLYIPVENLIPIQ